MNRAAIYAIRNTVNGKRYVGSSADASRRLYEHRYLLERGRHFSVRLQRAWAKHGSGAFLFEIVEQVLNRNALLTREQFWIDYFNSAHPRLGYNTASVAGTRYGVPQPASVAEKMRAVHLGKSKSAEHRSKISAAMKGRPKSSEHKAKLAKATARQYSDPAARLKAAEYGRMAAPHVISDEAREKMKEGRRRWASTPAGRAVLLANLHQS